MLHVTSLDFSFSGRVVKTLQDTEITGFYFDLLKFLLTAIFNLQEEEEAEEQELESNAEAYEGTVVHSRFSRVVFQVALLTSVKWKGFACPHALRYSGEQRYFFAALKDLKVENASHKELVRQATIVAQWPQLYYGNCCHTKTSLDQSRFPFVQTAVTCLFLLQGSLYVNSHWTNSL